MTCVREHMSAPPLTIDCHQSLAEAAELMCSRGVRHLAVLDRGRPVGVLSERDLYRLESRKPVEPEVLSVGQAMSSDAYVVRPDEPLAAVAREMARRGLGSALIAEGAQLLGIFTTMDALRALAVTLGAKPAPVLAPAADPAPDRR